jgi:hypothetical protein
VYSNISETDFSWGAPNEFGDLVRLVPSPNLRNVVSLRLRVLNSSASTLHGNIVLRLYPGPPDEGAPIFERSYPVTAPIGESSATFAIPNVEVEDTLAYTIEGLPTGVEVGWNDAPTLGSSSDFYFIKDSGGPGTGWTQSTFGGAPLIANIAAEIVCFPSTAGDQNADGVVDPADAMVFVACLSGPGAHSDPSCNCGPDVDGDGDVDLRDFAALQRSFVGTVEPCSASPEACDDANACTTDTCDSITIHCRYALIACNDNNACTLDRCDPDVGCVHPLAGCGGPDGCCPSGCTYSNDPDCCRPRDAACTTDSQCCAGHCRGQGICN